MLELLRESENVAGLNKNQARQLVQRPHRNM